MTTANKITIVRILLVPFFVVEVLYYMETGNAAHRWIALVSFAVAAVCDGVDGVIARRFNQRSELGAILDPLADKLLLVSGVVPEEGSPGGQDAQREREQQHPPRTADHGDARPGQSHQDHVDPDRHRVGRRAAFQQAGRLDLPQPPGEVGAARCKRG